MPKTVEQQVHTDLSVLKWIAGVSGVVFAGIMTAFLLKMWEVPTDIAVIKSDISAVRQRQDLTDGETGRWRDEVGRRVQELEGRVFRNNRNGFP